MSGGGFAYALGGDDFCGFAVAPAPLGLPLPDRDDGAGTWFGVADDAGGGGGGAAAVLWALGEVAVGGGRSEPYDGLSWGAGDTAMATAVLMIGVRAPEGGVVVQKMGFE